MMRLQLSPVSVRGSRKRHYWDDIQLGEAAHALRLEEAKKSTSWREYHSAGGRGSWGKEEEEEVTAKAQDG